MQILDLSNLDRSDVKYKTFVFPGGEPHFQLHRTVRHEDVLIRWRFSKSEDIIILMLAVDALRRAGFDQIRLDMPYVPFARQDRVMVKGEPLSIKVFATLINSLGFQQVYSVDTHSDVTKALLNNYNEVSILPFVLQAVEAEQQEDSDVPVTIVSPDLGASKKSTMLCRELMEAYQDVSLLECSKVRDVATGQIKATHVPTTQVTGGRFLVVDDICDGGRTFVELAKAIRQQGNPDALSLYVTHGIFSNGLEELAKHYDTIYTTDTYYQGKGHDKLRVFPYVLDVR